MNDPLKLGFIGLGAMGLPMASNLISKAPPGSTLRVYDISENSMRTLVERHPVSVVICRSPKDVSQKAEIIFTMLPEGSHVRSVYLDPSTGILGPGMSARLLVDCSTIDTKTSLQVARETETHDSKARFYDAPVSGGTLGAEAASLTIMMGCADDGSDAQYALLDRLLRLMGKTVVACGGPGMGLTAKLCNNYCSGLISLATAEAMNMGMRSGMDPRVLSRIFASSTAQSTICDKWNPVPGICPDAPSSKGYAGGFKVQLMAKDFGLAVAAADEVGAKLVLGRAGLEAYEGASRDKRCRDRDSRVLFRYIGGREDWE
ncbi:NAD binding domain of 6-phosphogluconate dehydrogenase-domain-containing protein [Dactylonectria estremocensis]|uniref:3-hydroxyisobutyrate dehydrogenase n=1 Tax=Dactylonectria estremocensis TaxID=1079267 RepID=A0A9P9DG22_9HYPO|nr:NAD binding domain of 6-phosphogluconate dehydrogenase-domain-containing protein [Dactylonectria estremocensis]